MIRTIRESRGYRREENKNDLISFLKTTKLKGDIEVMENGAKKLSLDISDELKEALKEISALTIWSDIDRKDDDDSVFIAAINEMGIGEFNKKVSSLSSEDQFAIFINDDEEVPKELETLQEEVGTHFFLGSGSTPKLWYVKCVNSGIIDPKRVSIKKWLNLWKEGIIFSDI